MSINIHGRHLAVRIWPPAVRWTWPIQSREDRERWIGQRTTSLGFGARDCRWPHWVSIEHDPYWLSHSQDAS